MQSFYIFSEDFIFPWAYYSCRRGDHLDKRGHEQMILMVILGLVSIFGIIGTISSIKNKNILGFIFGAGSAVVFGWFTIMTILNNGFPVAH